jgi:hypothetical protein
MEKNSGLKRRKRFDPFKLTCYFVPVNRNLNLNLLLTNALLTSAAVGF